MPVLPLHKSLHCTHTCTLPLYKGCCVHNHLCILRCILAPICAGICATSSQT